MPSWTSELHIYFEAGSWCDAGPLNYAVFHHYLFSWVELTYFTGHKDATLAYAGIYSSVALLASGLLSCLLSTWVRRRSQRYMYIIISVSATYRSFISGFANGRGTPLESNNWAVTVQVSGSKLQECCAVSLHHLWHLLSTHTTQLCKLIDHLDGLSDVQLQFEHPTETAKPPFEADTSPFQSTEVEMSPFQSTEADMSPFQSTEVEMSPFQSTEADMSPFHSALQCILHMAHETSQLQVVQECVTGPMTLTSRHSTATAPPLPLHYPLRQLCGVRVMEGARKGRKGREEGMVLVRELVRDWMGRDVRSTEDVTRSDPLTAL